MRFASVLVPKPAAVVRDRLSQLLSQVGSDYRGSVSDDGFRAVRTFRMFERRMPVTFIGQFEASGDCTVIQIGARPAWITLAFVAIWTLICARTVCDFPVVSDESWLHAAFAAGPVLFVGFLVLVSMAIESRWFEAWVRKEIAK